MPVFGGNLPAAAAKPPKSGRGHPGGRHPAQPIYLFIHLSGRGGSGNGGPVLRYRYRHETSNIPLFEYNEHEFSIGFRAITF